jgi:hypothetical protein
MQGHSIFGLTSSKILATHLHPHSHANKRPVTHCSRHGCEPAAPCGGCNTGTPRHLVPGHRTVRIQPPNTKLSRLVTWMSQPRHAVWMHTTGSTFARPFHIWMILRSCHTFRIHIRVQTNTGYHVSITDAFRARAMRWMHTTGIDLCGAIPYLDTSLKILATHSLVSTLYVQMTGYSRSVTWMRATPCGVGCILQGSPTLQASLSIFGHELSRPGTRAL